MATKQRGAGGLREKLAFQRRTESDDGFGTIVTGDFQTVFEEYAEMTARMGSEAVMASRLQGVQPYTAKIRSSVRAREIDATWRAVGRDGAVYSIVSPPVNMSMKNDYIDILMTVGGNGQ